MQQQPILGKAPGGTAETAAVQIGVAPAPPAQSQQVPRVNVAGARPLLGPASGRIMPPLDDEDDEEAKEEARMEELRKASQQNARTRRGGRDASRSPRLEGEDEPLTPAASPTPEAEAHRGTGADGDAVPAVVPSLPTEA